MKLGIYKPFKQIYFKENTDDHAGWSFEVVNLVKILVKNGHTIDILSDTDLKPGEITNITPVNLSSVHDMYDRIFIFCGTMNEQEQKNIKLCRSLTSRLDFIFTDYNLKPFSFSIFDNIYTQSKQINTYAALEKLVLFGKQFNNINNINKKDIQFYFGGTERNRLNDFIEYIWRPDAIWHGKSQFFNANKYVSYAECNKYICRSKYSIVIMDIEYNNIGWVTPRYYENIMNDTICFVDKKCDRDELLIMHDDFRRVSSYKEMYEKIKYLENNHSMKMTVITRQHKEIHDAYLDGSYIYSQLFNDKK